MADAIDNEIARIDAELAKVRQALLDLADQLADPTDTQLVDSTSQVSGFKGSQRYAMLREREAELMEQKAMASLWDKNIPLAIGNDITGGDETETNLS